MDHDVVVIGGGIVGLATALRLSEQRPGTRAIVVEKEADVAAHQTGHNSGVIHSGIYYRPDSMKARTCRAGKAALEAFCEAEGIPFERCGKVIVATRPEEVPRLDALIEKGRANGVTCERIGPERLRELEPHAAGLAAVWVPEAGIIDYKVVADRYAAKIRDAGGRVVTNARALGIVEESGGVTVQTTAGDFSGKVAVSCAGLHSDRVASMGAKRRADERLLRIVPFRGEFYELRPEARGLVRSLIYPAPNPALPFLGVHFTLTIEGTVECGPNAVLALAREGYRWRDISLGDLLPTLFYRGFLRLAARYWRTGIGEVWRSLSKRAFVKALQHLVPEIRSEHLVPAPAGVRAQAVTTEGRLLDDFHVVERERIVHVVNAPSPAATASLAIGEHVAGLVIPRLDA